MARHEGGRTYGLRASHPSGHVERLGVPAVGDVVMVRGVAATVYHVHQFGTVDVETADGRCFRVSGLAAVRVAPTTR